MNKIGIMGSGAFGTGLAATFAKATNDVTLWGRNSECIKEINSKNTNSRYLPGIELPKNIFATSNFKDLKNLDVLLMVTPAQYLRETLKNFDIKSLNCPLVVCSKGIEKNTGKLQSEIIKDVIGNTQLSLIHISEPTRPY